MSMNEVAKSEGVFDSVMGRRKAAMVINPNVTFSAEREDTVL
jgi:hypothetical protein